MIRGVLKSNMDYVTIFYSFDCHGCENWDFFEVSYEEYHSLNDIELLDKYAIV